MPAPECGHPRDAELFGVAPCYHDQRPLRWLPGQTLAEPELPVRLLSAVAVLEDARPVRNDEDDPLLAEIQSLDAKLNLLIDMVGSLYERQTEKPPPREFQMSAHMLRFAGDGAAPGSGEQGLIELHVHPFVAHPLHLPASLVACEVSDGGWTGWWSLDDAPPALAEALERHVFRRHRREIADARTATARQLGDAVDTESATA